MIIFGSQGSKIGSFDIPNSSCQHCGQESTQRISVFGKYAHVFWIPMFPIGKKAVAECTHCLRTIEDANFSPKLQQLYRNNHSKVKRPLWHWAGLGIIGSLFALIMIIGITAEKDPRREFLNKDLSMMTSSPTMESDSISFKIKELFDEMVTDKINPQDFEYLTKIQGNKALILVKMPKLKKVEKTGRSEAIEMIEMITNTQADLKDKEKYIGVQGAISMLLIKTPTYEKNSRLAMESELYEFYGKKTEIKK
jgi:hypothetical protein